MAQLVMGFGSSHSPMLNTGPEGWRSIGAGADPGNPWLFDMEGHRHTFEELVAAAPPWIDAQLTPHVMEEKSERAQQAIDELAAAVERARLDALIVVGDDQNEHVLASNRPGMLIYYGPTIPNRTFPADAQLPEGYREAILRYYEPERDRDYPVAVELAEYLIDFLMDRHFDLVTSNELPTPRPEGHAFQFVHRRLMRSELPVVPIMLNTYNPPTQPRAARCFELGRRIAEAVASFGENQRVGILASGGLTHFVIDEEFDRMVLALFEKGDGAGLSALPETALQSGTSEIKNWICVAGACEGLRFRLIDYVPGYRTRARTGTALGFATWS